MSSSSSKSQNQGSSIPYLSPELIKSLGLSNLSEKQQSNALYVTNISKTATIKQVNEFFGYCGVVEKIVQDFDANSPKEDPKQFAIVVFETEQSFSVALLLGASVIEGTPINVHPYTTVLPPQSQQQHQQQQQQNSSSQQQQSSQGQHKSATSVIATLVATGYIKGEGLINEMKSQAKELDSHANIGSKVKQAYNFSIEKYKKFDSDYKVTETLNTIKNKALETTTTVYKTIDNTLGLEQKAKDAKEFTLKTANKAMEIEPIKNSVEFVQSSWNYLKDQWNNMNDEMTTEISKQKGTVTTKPISATSPRDGNQQQQQSSSTTTTTTKKEDMINLEDETQKK